MATNATLIYTGENKAFRYEDGLYVTTGQKVITNDVFTRVEGGNIQKDGVFIASFNFNVENGVRKNTWYNIPDPDEEAKVISTINALFTALNTTNIAE